MRLLVTGAGGELGRGLRRRLEGHEWHDFKAGLVPCDAVLHLAGRKYDAQGTSEDYETANVEFTRFLLSRLAEMERPPRVVFFSTMYVYGESSERPWREEMTPRPGTDYGRTKLAAERLVAESGLPFVILRLATVYGTGGDDVLKKMAAAYKATGPFVVGDGAQRRSLLSLERLALLTEAALTQKRWLGLTVNAADEKPHLARELARRATGAEPRRVPALLAAAGAGAAALLGRTEAADGLRRLGRDFELDVHRLEGLLR